MSIKNMFSLRLPKVFSFAPLVSRYTAKVPDTAFSEDKRPAKHAAPSQEESGPLAAVLLAAVLAASLVVADQLMETWVNGHLLAAWVALWVVAFTALALFSTPLQQFACYAVSAAKRWKLVNSQEKLAQTMGKSAQFEHRIRDEKQQSQD